jgi:L-ribulose-5-phosphate 4-epimerase
MTDEYIRGNYERNTGFQIIDCLKERQLDYREIEMILVGSHAPFTWGKNALQAVHNSAVLEQCAQMAYLSKQINPEVPRLKETLIKKHFQRKHGPDSYYGQT